MCRGWLQSLGISAGRNKLQLHRDFPDVGAENENQDPNRTDLCGDTCPDGVHGSRCWRAEQLLRPHPTAWANANFNSSLRTGQIIQEGEVRTRKLDYKWQDEYVAAVERITIAD